MTMLTRNPQLRVWESLMSSSGTRMWRRRSASAPCGAVSKAFDTSKARTWFSSCPRCSLRSARKIGAAAVEPGMAPNCQSAASPLRAKTAVSLRMRGEMSLSCCPSATPLYSSRLPVAVPLGISK